VPIRTQRLPITFEEFEQLPYLPGWKYEYFEGQAHISPSHQVVLTTVAVTHRHVDAPCILRAVRSEDEVSLLPVYLEAFAENQAFCDFSDRQFAKAARDDLHESFAGRRAPLLAASRVALVQGANGESLVGAALLSRDSEYGPVMDLLFVVPAWQRRGLATALVASAMNALAQDGDSTLTSSYQLANRPSQAWHQAFGFVERPDLRYAQAYYRWAHHELARRTVDEELTASERAALQAQVEYWRHRVEALERLAEEKGYESVAPRFLHG
jgi:GNAT superfamily N-acetyltransferase